MKSLVVIPAFNEATVIKDVILGVKKHAPSMDIVVIDDGSTDHTFQKAKEAGVTIIRHAINRGLGGAISTGLTYARKNNYHLAVTIDADGQHDPNDIKKLVKPIVKKQADVVIGSRIKQSSFQVPIDRRFIIFLSNFLTYLLFGFKTTDSQSGFRAFSKKALEKIEIKTQAMEVSSEIFSQIANNGLQYQEVPIKVIYSEYSRSKGQANLNAVNVALKLLLRLAR